MVGIATKLARLRQTNQTNINQQTSKAIMGLKVLNLRLLFCQFKNLTYNLDHCFSHGDLLNYPWAMTPIELEK